MIELNGASVQSAEPKPTAEADGEIVRGADDETTVVGGGGAPDVGETARASARDGDDILIKLDQLMDFVKAQADDANQTKDVVGALCSRMGAVEIGAVAGSPTRMSQEATAEAPAAAELSVDQLLRARELPETVMEALRGKPPPDDPSLSPIKRLDAQMAPGVSDASVHQSPKQMKTRSATVVEQVVRERAKAEALAEERGEELVAQRGTAGAAVFIAAMTGLDDAGRLALEHSFELKYGGGSGRVSPPNVGDEGDDEDVQSGCKVAAGGDDDDEGSELQSDDEGEKRELVEYVHGNRTSVSRAELLGEGLDDE